MTQVEILKQVDDVIAMGPFKDNWESLTSYKPAKWYRDAKFGIFIHWGVYSVPAFGNEWYPRNMYLKNSDAYKHHVENWGAHDKFGYKDFVPMFKAENYDPKQWVKLFKKSGAKYVMPVAEHHDGFQMYESSLSEWNAKKMGPKRDLIGELKTELEKEDIVFTVSNHRAEHSWFFNGGLEFDSDVSNKESYDFYDKQHELDASKTHDITSTQPPKEHLDNWLARICELVDKYQPQIVWFDWWIHNLAFKPYLKKFAAFYYNRAEEWGKEVAINYKYNAYAYESAIFDVERGQLSGIRPVLWQTDTSIAKNSWGYTKNNDFKTAVELVGDLVDIVSKNGCLLLNIGPKSDGTIAKEEADVLLEIGKWLEKNGEGIYETTFWQQFGEGPTNVEEGAFTDSYRSPYTHEDFRFTYKNGTVYAFAMNLPKGSKTTIPSLGYQLLNGVGGGDFDITEVRMLGNNVSVTFERDDKGLHINASEEIDTDYPVGFAIKID